jgi:hypothetical protein
VDAFCSFTTTTNRAIGSQSVFSSLMLKDFLNQNPSGPATLILTRLTIATPVEPFASRENGTYPPPTLTYVTMPRLPDQAVPRNSTTGPLAFTVFSAMTNASNLIVTASSSNPNLVPATNLVLGGSGGNRTVTITPASNQTGIATVTLSVSDGIATTDSLSFQVNVSPSLSAPAYSGGQFGFRIDGSTGVNYTVQASSNLATWTPLSMTNPAIMPWLFTDPGTGNLPRKYYRVQQGP